MIIYRPHRGSFSDAMAEAAEFESESDMLAYIVATETDNSLFDSAPFSLAGCICQPSEKHFLLIVSSQDFAFL